MNRKLALTGVVVAALASGIGLTGCSGLDNYAGKVGANWSRKSATVMMQRLT